MNRKGGQERRWTMCRCWFAKLWPSICTRRGRVATHESVEDTTRMMTAVGLGKEETLPEIIIDPLQTSRDSSYYSTAYEVEHVISSASNPMGGFF